MNKKATQSIRDSLTIFYDIDELQETMNILKYHFLFDLEMDKIKELSDIFDNQLFISQKAFEIPENLLGSYNFGACTKRIGAIYQNIQSHCIISALHTAKYLIWKEEGEEVYHGYTASKKLEYDDYNAYGLKVRDFFIKPDTQNLTADKSFSFSLLGKTPKPNDSNDNKLEIPVYNLKLYDKIITNNKFFLKTKNKQTMRTDRFIDLMHIYEKIATIPLAIKNNSDKVDTLLLSYQLERYFNAALFESLYQKHHAHHSNPENEIVLLGNSYLETIEKFSLLPNAFSRSLFVDWAYEAISAENYQKIFVNYFNSPSEMKFNLIVNEDTDREDLKFNPQLKTPNTAYGTWLNTLESAIEYLSTVTFPMYEKTFFTLLFNSFKSSDSENLTILKKMEEMLQEYCEKNYEELCQNNNHYKQPSFSKWDNNSENIPSKEEIAFYLKLMNVMLAKNNLQNLYKVTFTTKYFSSCPQAPVSQRLLACADYYQRQSMYLKNISNNRDIYC